MKKSYSRQKNNRLSGIRMALVVLLSYSFVVLVGIKGNILCLEADGCVTLEIAQNGVCCSFSTGASPTDSHSLPELTSLAHEDPCGPCVDIPLWIEGADHYLITDHEQENQPTALIAFSPSTSGLTAIESPLQIPSPGINLSLTSHRTVILLI